MATSWPAGLQPVLVHLSKNDKGKFSFNPLSVNLMVEVFKVVFALVVLLILVRNSSSKCSSSSTPWRSRQQRSRWTAAGQQAVCTADCGRGQTALVVDTAAATVPDAFTGRPCFSRCLHTQGTGRPGPPMYRSLRSFIADARHNWLLAVPAGLYAINNYLKFAMQVSILRSLACTDCFACSAYLRSIQATLSTPLLQYTDTALLHTRSGARPPSRLVLCHLYCTAAVLQAHHHKDAGQPQDLHDCCADAHSDAQTLQHTAVRGALPAGGRCGAAHKAGKLPQQQLAAAAADRAAAVVGAAGSGPLLHDC